MGQQSPSDNFSMDSVTDVYDNDEEMIKFDYFKAPDFFAELDHFEYIMQKYIYDSATLQINISSAMRLESATVSPGMDSDRLIKMMKQIRNELHTNMKDSFGRFKNTDEFNKLAEVLQS